MMTDKSMDFLEKQGSSATKALEVLREELPLQRFVGESLSQAVVEGEVALPGGLREETTVLSAEAMAVLERSLAQADRVTVDGKIFFACVDGPEFDGHKVNWDEFMSRLRQYKDEEKISMEKYEAEVGEPTWL